MRSLRLTLAVRAEPWRPSLGRADKVRFGVRIELMNCGLCDSDMRSAVATYGRRVLRLFRDGGRLDALAGAGVALPFERRRPLAVHDTPKEADSMQAREDRDGPSSPIPERDLFEGWCRAQIRPPLLIEGPFGSGKSGLLTQFAVWLAEELINPELTLDAMIVPLPVRLRFWVEFAGNHWTGEDTATARWWEFLEASQRIFPGFDDKGALTVDQFKELHHCGRLAVLYDGLDELPGPQGEDIHLTRRWVLRMVRNLHRDTGFMLSCRPGYNDAIELQDAQRYVVQELGPDAINQLVQDTLPPACQEVAREAQETLEPGLGHLLPRPLFLAAWVEHVRMHSEAPRSVETLMLELTHRCFDGRRKETKGLTRAQIDQMLPELGRVLSAFAHRQFSQSLGVDDVLAVRREPDLDRRMLVEALQLGEGVGFLMPVGAAKWRAAKVPVVEFLIGRYLAGLACGTHEEQQRFVRVFRRWVWMPETFECLEHLCACFAKWPQSPVPVALVTWLLNCSEGTDRHLSLRALKPMTVCPLDDAARPHAFLAFRLTACLDIHGLIGHGATDFVREVARAAVRAMADYDDLPCAVPSAWTAMAATAFVHEIIIKFDPAQYDDAEADDWSYYLGRSVRQATSTNLQPVLAAFMTWHNDPDREIEQASLDAARPAEDPGVPSDLMPTSCDHSIREVWRSLIVELARQLPGGAACTLLARWTTEYFAHVSEPRSAYQRSLVAAIRGAIEAVPSNNTAGILAVFLKHCDDQLRDRAGLSWSWQVARLGRCLPYERGREVLLEFLRRCRLVGTQSEQRKIWQTPIRWAAERVAAIDAADTVTELLDLSHDVASAVGINEAVGPIAQRVPEGRAGQLYEDCLRRCLESSSDAECHLCLQACAGAAKVIGQARGLPSVLGWITACGDASRGDGEQRIWRKTLPDVVDGLKPSDVANAVRALLGFYREQLEDLPLRVAIRSALSRAMDHLPRREVGNTMQELIREYGSPRTECARDWRRMIASLGLSMGVADAVANLDNWLELHAAEPSEDAPWFHLCLRAAELLPRGAARTVADSFLSALDNEPEHRNFSIMMMERLSNGLQEADATQFIEALVSFRTTHPEWQDFGGLTNRAVARLSEKITDGTNAERIFQLLCDDGTPMAGYGALDTKVACIWQYDGSQDRLRTRARRRDDETLILDEHEACVPDVIREILQPFAPEREGYGPAEQYALLADRMRERIAHKPEWQKLGGFPEGGKSQAKKRKDVEDQNSWCEAFRVLASTPAWGLLKPEDVCEVSLPKGALGGDPMGTDGGRKRRGKVRYVRKTAFLSALASNGLVDGFVCSLIWVPGEAADRPPANRSVLVYAATNEAKKPMQSGQNEPRVRIVTRATKLKAHILDLLWRAPGEGSAGLSSPDIARSLGDHYVQTGDSEFNVDREYVTKLCRELAGAKLIIEWGFNKGRIWIHAKRYGEVETP